MKIGPHSGEDRTHFHIFKFAKYFVGKLAKVNQFAKMSRDDVRRFSLPHCLQEVASKARFPHEGL